MMSALIGPVEQRDFQSATSKANIARARELIAMPVPPDPRAEDDNTDQAAGAATDHLPPCPAAVA